MFQTLSRSKSSVRSVHAVSFAGIAALFIALPVSLSAQQYGAPDRYDAYQNQNQQTFSCQSVDGQRSFCRADVSRGPVQMTRQLGDVRCIENENWGRQPGGVWVDRGCRAEFALAPERRPESTQIEPGTVVPVRTNERISAERADGRVFTGVVDQDVMGHNGVVAIPRGSNVELLVRTTRDNDLILDLDSVTVDGQRYAVNAQANRVDSKDSLGANSRTGKYVGGGAILGAIMGAAIGGGKGAAIGAGVGAGAGAGAEIATSGRNVSVPSESVVTFRIDRPLVVGVADTGEDRDGNHYHRFDDYDRRYDDGNQR
jgi:hypothetical protein